MPKQDSIKGQSTQISHDEVAPSPQDAGLCQGPEDMTKGSHLSICLVLGCPQDLVCATTVLHQFRQHCCRQRLIRRYLSSATQALTGYVVTLSLNTTKRAGLGRLLIWERTCFTRAKVQISTAPGKLLSTTAHAYNPNAVRQEADGQTDSLGDRVASLVSWRNADERPYLKQKTDSTW